MSLTVKYVLFFTAVTTSHAFCLMTPANIDKTGFVSLDRRQKMKNSRVMVNIYTDVSGAIEGLWESYNSAIQSDPLVTKSITASVILGAADVTGQVVEQKLANDGNDDEFRLNVARGVRFAIFGLVLQAPWIHYWFQFLDKAIPPTADPLTVTNAAKVVADQFVQAPIFTVLIFFFLGLLEGKSVDAIKKQLGADYKDTMLANWQLWIPATVVNIGYCPPPFRVLFVNVIFFFWSIFLSLKLNKKDSSN